MKSHLFIIIMLIFSLSCRNNTNPSPKVSTNKTEVTLTPIFKGFYFLGNHSEYGNFILFDIILTNNTKSPLEFWTFTAAPIANIVLDPDKLNFFVPTFSSNWPVIVKLYPGQEFVVPLILNRSDSTRINSLRFGFLLIKPKYKMGSSKELDPRKDPRKEFIEMSKNKENFIWSQMIEFHPTMNEFRYQIRTIINDSTYSIVPREKLFK